MKRTLLACLGTLFLGMSSAVAQSSLPIDPDAVPVPTVKSRPEPADPEDAIPVPTAKSLPKLDAIPVLPAKSLPEVDGIPVPRAKSLPKRENSETKFNLGTPQEGPVPVPKNPAPVQGPVDFGNLGPCPETRFWASAEYLLWRISNPPLRVPLVTGNADPATIGALNDPGTTVLFGAGAAQTPRFGWFSGGRVTVGGWLDQSETIGIEVSGFLLEDRPLYFNAASLGGNAPIVSIPFNATAPFNNNPAGPANLFNNPAGPTALSAGGTPNAILSTLTSQLWGAEANAVVALSSSSRLRTTGLIGFRYLDLRENLTLTDAFFDGVTGGALSVTDGFGTRNQFYGGQIGGRASWTRGRFIVDTDVRVALGSNHETLHVAGATTVTNGAFGFASGAVPGGVFAQNTNIGEYDRDMFTVIPEVRIKLGYAITPNIQSFVGYNLLYVSNTLRPGNQIDSNTQALFFLPPGTAGAPAPSTLHSSSFYAHGINFGLAFKF